MLIPTIKALMVIWPFIRENALGNKKLGYLNKRDRPLTLMLVSVFVLFGLFVYVTDHAFSNSADLAKARRKLEMVSHRLKEAEDRLLLRDKQQLKLHSRIIELEVALGTRDYESRVTPKPPTPTASDKVERPSNKGGSNHPPSAVDRYNQLE